MHAATCAAGHARKQRPHEGDVSNIPQFTNTNSSCQSTGAAAVQHKGSKVPLLGWTDTSRCGICSGTAKPSTNATLATNPTQCQSSFIMCSSHDTILCYAARQLHPSTMWLTRQEYRPQNNVVIMTKLCCHTSTCTHGCDIYLTQVGNIYAGPMAASPLTPSNTLITNNISPLYIPHTQQPLTGQLCFVY